ncbi:PHP domain-containing protein [Angustibacter aerolatus]|uniref:PHP domain-containing protein n=1 Tax=Angustibacter aerolatus TaxID=1162965 RepID=A0ABQ6JNY7_9ACTN|nr:histidinol phosphatase [Angustibacter aerolatus]GMA89296.1 PHP domain-containing protein [Angustibacter aerolatus]
MMSRVDPLAALRRISFLLERTLESTYRVQAFRNAAAVVAGTPPDALAARHAEGTLTDLKGIGDRTAGVIAEAMDGAVPGYLVELEAKAGPLVEARRRGRGVRGAAAGRPAQPLRLERRRLADRGDGDDCRRASGSPTSRSPTTPPPQGRQRPHPVAAAAALEVVDGLAGRLGDFRLLRGIECDVNEDGSLDQEPEPARRGSTSWSPRCTPSLRMDRAPMTRRMLRAVADPHTDVLGHCTGRYVQGNRRTGKERPQSQFDAEAVFAACAEHQVAVEINCRPERQDPPDDLLTLAVEAGCLFSIDTDAHAPGQARLARVRRGAGGALRRRPRPGGHHVGRRPVAGVDEPQRVSSGRLAR